MSNIDRIEDVIEVVYLNNNPQFPLTEEFEHLSRTDESDTKRKLFTL